MRYEWSTFSNDLKSGFRSGNLLTILSKNISIKDLPSSLRHKQSFTLKDYQQHILPYLGKAQSSQDPNQNSHRNNVIAGPSPVIAGHDRQSPKSKKITWLALIAAAGIAAIIGLFLALGGSEEPVVAECLLEENQEVNQIEDLVRWDNIEGTHNGHGWVDLGLSVKWATTNVGASTPGDYGNYYAWAETSPKSSHDWTNLKYRTSGDSNSNISFCKYNTKRGMGIVDNITGLELSDDVARQNWGGSWRMPTDAEWTELREKCTWTWTIQNGHNGYKVIGPNDRSIFLPAAMWQVGSRPNGDKPRGCYWSSSLDTDHPQEALGVEFTSSFVSSNHSARYEGQSVRPVTDFDMVKDDLVAVPADLVVVPAAKEL